MMRIVFQNGKQVGTDPINHYVYLWRHGEIDCYVGKASRAAGDAYEAQSR